MSWCDAVGLSLTCPVCPVAKVDRPTVRRIDVKNVDHKNISAWNKGYDDDDDDDDKKH